VSIIVMGVCGSGKSTLGPLLARRLGWRFIEGDDLHPPANVAKMSAGQPLDDADRWPWLDAIAAAIATEHRHGGEVVVACSALKRAYRERLATAGGPLLFVHLDGDPSMLSKRMARRQAHFMPPDLLATQLETLEPPGSDEPAMVLEGRLAPRELVDRICRTLSAIQPSGIGKVSAP
jgi:gluconokinase